MDELKIRKATVADATPILALINELAVRQVMLPRSPKSVLELLRDFFVAEVDGRFAGCGALHIVWSDLAEVRSLAVDPGVQAKGIGRRLVEAMVEDAEAIGLPKVFAFTYVPGFFEKLGFEVVPHETLPRKVFYECTNCPKFTCCDEVAVVRVLREDDGTSSIERIVSERPLRSRP